jgi:hypothetical protein
MLHAQKSLLHRIGKALRAQNVLNRKLSRATGDETDEPHHEFWTLPSRIFWWGGPYSICDLEAASRTTHQATEICQFASSSSQLGENWFCHEPKSTENADGRRTF